jgi:hypothetical protein
MAVGHPIDAEIRAWLAEHVENESKLSLAVGHSKTWLHKYINGSGHATVDDLVRIAALLLGLNMPALNDSAQKMLKSFQALSADDQKDVIAYAEHRKRLALREASKESSEPVAQSPLVTTGKARGKR